MARVKQHARRSSDIRHQNSTYDSNFASDPTLGLPPVATSVFIFALGAIIGSFLNVVIHRLPREESIVFRIRVVHRAARTSVSTTTSPYLVT
jgi:hypothetical protein